MEDHPRQAYILLDPRLESFQNTLLHEIGYVVMRMLARGDDLPVADVCSVPHATSALTDRLTAFSEG